ncbi:MAG TPA: hypothetical protein VFV63_00715 [Ilumatobacteraceae bacterium]|nr:hypothetical protein [Ilumatobacteraceae bacterium]
MPFVSRSGEDEEESSSAPSGAPPIDWDPNDPDAVNVLYDVSAWSVDQRAELAAAFADAGHPHAWEGDELVVPEEIEEAVDELFDRLERELGPFPVGLAADVPSTEFGLDEWPPADIELLKNALVEAEIPHRWDGSTLHVAPDAEGVVDDLLDAIESGDLASLGDDAGGAPEGALNLLFTTADRLARDPGDATARNELFDVAALLDARQPPFGVTVRVWSHAVAAAQTLIDDFHAADHDPSDVIGHAQELRTIVRPFV